MRVQCAQDSRMSPLILLGLFWVTQLPWNTTVMERRFWIWWRGRLMCVVVVVVFVFCFCFFLCMVNETCNRSLHMTCCIWQNVTEHPSSLAHTLWLSTHHHLHTHCHHFIINTVIHQCSAPPSKHKYIASEIVPLSTPVMRTLSITGLNMNFQISQRKMTFSDYLIQHVSKHAFRWHHNSMIYI